MVPPVELTEESKSAHYASFPSMLGIVFIIIFYMYCGLMVFTLQITGTQSDWPWLVRRSYVNLRRFGDRAGEPRKNGKKVGTICRWAAKVVALTGILLVSLLQMSLWPITAVWLVGWLLSYAAWALWYAIIRKGGEGAVAKRLESALEHRWAMPAPAYCRRMMAAARRGRKARQPDTQEAPHDWAAPEGGIRMTVIVGKSGIGRYGDTEHLGQVDVPETPRQPVFEQQQPTPSDRTGGLNIHPSTGLSMIREESVREAGVYQPTAAHLKPPTPWSPV